MKFNKHEYTIRQNITCIEVWNSIKKTPFKSNVISGLLGIKIVPYVFDKYWWEFVTTVPLHLIDHKKRNLICVILRTSFWHLSWSKFGRDAVVYLTNTTGMYVCLTVWSVWTSCLFQRYPLHQESFPFNPGERESGWYSRFDPCSMKLECCLF